MLSEQELLKVCNQVREAGGVHTLTELEPGMDGEPDQCLIAINLNFDCEIDGRHLVEEDVEYQGEKYLDTSPKPWVMVIDSKEALHNIAEKMQWRIVTIEESPLYPEQKALLLPKELALSAEAFDSREYPDRLYLKNTEE